MEENTIDTTDRISMLPVFIVHHILSYLLEDPKSRARMSVLSKEWFALTASFPMFYFIQQGVWEKFCKYVQYTVSRFCKQNISACSLYMVADPENLEQVEFLERCLDLVLEKGLQVMYIYFRHPENMPMCRLPNTLLSASSLTSLKLSQCELPSSLMVGVVNLKSLRVLSLSLLTIDEGVIEYLTKGCPLLENFYLIWCYGFKTICVKRHHNLRKVMIFCESILESIDVDAPNLSYFLLENDIDRSRNDDDDDPNLSIDRAPSMSLGSCKKLTSFYYGGFPLIRFSDFLSNFPFIEDVCLNLSSPIDNLKLSSHFLRRLNLRSVCDLEDIDINAPNLLWFRYDDRICIPNITSMSMIIPSRGKECMQCHTNKLDILSFQKLRRFVEKNSIFKVLKLVFLYWRLRHVEELKLIQLPPYEIEHVFLKPKDWETPLDAALVDAVLWCFRPRSLTFVLHLSKEDRDVVKYIYEKLLQQEDKGQTNIKFVLIPDSEHKQQFSDLNSLLEACYDPTSPKYGIGRWFIMSKCPLLIKLAF